MYQAVRRRWNRGRYPEREKACKAVRLKAGNLLPEGNSNNALRLANTVSVQQNGRGIGKDSIAIEQIAEKVEQKDIDVFLFCETKGKEDKEFDRYGVRFFLHGTAHPDNWRKGGVGIALGPRGVKAWPSKTNPCRRHRPRRTNHWPTSGLLQ